MDMDEQTRKAVVRHCIDASIESFRKATELTIKTLEAMRDNPECQCMPDGLGHCSSCEEITKKLIVGQTVVDLVDITDEAGALYGAPDSNNNDAWPELIE